MNDCLKSFERKLLESTDRETGKTRPNQFRCSALPICPLRWVATELLNQGKIPEKENLSLDIYAGIGTQLHSVLQKWGGFKGLLYGDWELTREIKKEIEGKTYSRKSTKTIKSKLGPITDESGQPYTYKELVVRHPKTGLSGHVDGLVPYLDGYIIVDFKTSASSKLLEMNSPPINYHTQVMAYWYLLSKFGPWDEQLNEFREPLIIYGTVIFFLGRDNPMKDTKMFVNKVLDKNLVLEQFKLYRMAQEALATKKFSDVIQNRSCHTKQEVLDSWCEFGILGCGVGNKKVAQNLKDLGEWN
jgi:hypothetical protein